MYPNRECQDKYTPAAIRCCDLERGGCTSICTEQQADVDPIQRGSIERAATYFEATYQCRALGMRLCTPHELLQCCGSGCGMDQSRVWTDAPCVVASFKARELGRTLVYLVLGLLLVALPILTCRVLSRLCRRAKAARKPRYAWTLDDYDALEDEDEDVEVGTRAAASAELDPYSEYMSVKSRKANHVELLHAIMKWRRALARRRERADAELTKRIAMAEKVRNSNAGAIAGAPEDAQAAALDREQVHQVHQKGTKKKPSLANEKQSPANEATANPHVTNPHVTNPRGLDASRIGHTDSGMGTVPSQKKSAAIEEDLFMVLTHKQTEDLEAVLARKQADAAKAHAALEAARKRFATAKPAEKERLAAELAKAEAMAAAAAAGEAASRSLEARNVARARVAAVEAAEAGERQRLQAEFQAQQAVADREREAAERARLKALDEARRAHESAMVKAQAEAADLTFAALRSWRAFFRWRQHAKKQRKLINIIRKAGEAFREFGEPQKVAFDAFKARAAFWDRAGSSASAISSRSSAGGGGGMGHLGGLMSAWGFGSGRGDPSVTSRGSVDPTAEFRLSEDGFWARSLAHRRRQSLVGAPVLKHGGVHGGVYGFAFRVVGGGLGMVVGVSDASEPEVTAAEAKAWGVHLTHGALYVKKKHSDKGTLGTQQLVPGIGADRKAIEGLTGDHELDETALAEAREVLADEKSDSIQRWQAATLLRIASYDESKPPLVVEVQVDMARRKIAFGLPGQPLVEAPVTISTAVRPWAFFWSDTDSVMLEARKPGRTKGRVLPAGAKPAAGQPSPTHRSPMKSLLPPLPPLRARAPDGSVPYYPLRQDNLATALRATSPRNATSPRKGSPRVPVEPILDPSQYLPFHMKPNYGSPENAGTGTAEANGVAKGWLTPAYGGVTSVGRKTPLEEQSPWRRTYQSVISSRGGVGKRTPRVGAPTPRSVASLAARSTGQKSSLLSPRGERRQEPTSHMWDVVKSVTLAYGDTYQQL